MSLNSARPARISMVIDPARAWIVGLVPTTPVGLTPVRVAVSTRPSVGLASARPVVIRDDCACPDVCPRDHPNE